MTDDSYRDDTIGYSIGNISTHVQTSYMYICLPVYMRWKIHQWNSIEPESLMNQFKPFPKSTPNSLLKFSVGS